MLIITACPDCGTAAEITDRFTLPSTDGPVPHLVLACAAGHHFRMPADMLPANPRFVGGFIDLRQRAQHDRLAPSPGAK